MSVRGRGRVGAAAEKIRPCWPARRSARGQFSSYVLVWLLAACDRLLGVAVVCRSGLGFCLVSCHWSIGFMCHTFEGSALALFLNAFFTVRGFSGIRLKSMASLFRFAEGRGRRRGLGQAAQEENLCRRMVPILCVFTLPFLEHFTLLAHNLPNFAIILRVRMCPQRSAYDVVR